MILILFYLPVLCLVVILFRKRYKYEGVVFFYLRRPLVTEWCLLSLSVSASFVLFQYALPEKITSFWFYFLLFSTLVVVYYCLVLISSSALVCSIPYVLLTPTFNCLEINITPQYIPALFNRTVAIMVVEKFIEDIICLQRLNYKKIRFQSHLISPGMRRYLEDRLSELAISYSSTPRKTPLQEVVLLNLRYGGRTRYRIFSHVKHFNGFKVQRVGSSFIINKQNTHSGRFHLPGR